MNVYEKDQGYGVARQYPGKPVTEVNSSSSATAPLEPPDGNLGVGVPRQAPTGNVELYDERIHGKEILGALDPDAVEPNPTPSWLAVFQSPAVLAITTLLVAAFLLFVTGEVVQFLQALQALPIPLRIPGYIVICLLVCLLAWSGMRLYLLVLGMRVTPAFDLSDVCEVGARPKIQRLSKTSPSDAKKVLHGILETYSFGDPRFMALLLGCEKTDREINEFRSQCQMLLFDIERSDESWTRLFHEQILAFLDDCARNRIRQYAKTVGVRTGLMPTGAIDLLIVSSNSLALLGDVCVLYSVRASRLGMLTLAAKIFMNTFVAARLEGQINALVKSTQEGTGKAAVGNTVVADTEVNTTVISAFFGEGTQSIFSSVASGLSKVAFDVGKRAAEGFGNYVLCLRFGDSCVKLIRPIKI